MAFSGEILWWDNCQLIDLSLIILARQAHKNQFNQFFTLSGTCLVVFEHVCWCLGVCDACLVVSGGVNVYRLI